MPRWDVHFDIRVDNGSVELRTLVANIDAISQLTGDIPLPPSVEARLNSLNIYRAVRGTTGIEGASLTTDEVEEILSRPGESVLPPDRQREEQEARNAADVMAYVASTGEDHLSEPLIAEIHRLTTDKISYSNNTPGKYRSHQPTVGTYLPPATHDEVRDLMARFVSWINSGERLTWHPIVRAIVSHFYIVSIHPFGDGNGRTSRGVESFLLFRAGINVRGFYSLANFYYENRAEYFAMLDHVRFETDGDLTPFILFALRGLDAELQLVRSEIVVETKWIAFRDFAREVVFGPDGPRTPTVALRLFQLTTRLPRSGIALGELKSVAHVWISEYKKLDDRTLARDVIRLIKLGLVRYDDDYVVFPNTEKMDSFTAVKLPGAQHKSAHPTS